jgi:hypothetical protein
MRPLVTRRSDGQRHRSRPMPRPWPSPQKDPPTGRQCGGPTIDTPSSTARTTPYVAEGQSWHCSHSGATTSAKNNDAFTDPATPTTSSRRPPDVPSGEPHPYEFLAFTGLRRGEACALRWSDVVLEDRVLNVRSSLVQVGPKWIEGKPKTASGERRVDLGERTVGPLLMVQLAQGEDRKRWGAAYRDNGRVFAREDGSDVSPEAVTKTFRRLATPSSWRRPACGRSVGCPMRTSGTAPSRSSTRSWSRSSWPHRTGPCSRASPSCWVTFAHAGP